MMGWKSAPRAPSTRLWRPEDSPDGVPEWIVRSIAYQDCVRMWSRRVDRPSVRRHPHAVPDLRGPMLPEKAFTSKRKCAAAGEIAPTRPGSLLPPTPARARIMRAIRGKGNRTTELAFARILRQRRLSGWRRHLRQLPGRPDFAWPRLRVAVFVDGCFWHGCPRCYRAPTRNTTFWAEKVAANRRRDRRVSARLRARGWSVLRVWECKVQAEATLSRVRKALSEAS